MSLQLLNKKMILKNTSKGKLIIFQTINSTNQYILEKINILKSGDVCIAEQQTNGRGKYGKIWISSFGKDLCLSIFWKFKKKIKKIINLYIILSLIIKKILYKLGIRNIQIKFPNDLYINNKKFAGILIENYYNITQNTINTVIGIGINVNIKNNSKNYFQKNWINLQDTGVNINRNILTIHLINALRKTLNKY
ncbi:MAG: DNA-binding transcriptional repressor/biotin-[acetyl-CoA-carboxylase] ligase BirA [Candidatus Westeberhardia cardiocondylae]|nr:DNA-binding transcriptional repressor/biotin-[acetyl-CoA-carboxylase] ligase BirA [Candidatus Westeberhardia cardiocondylae]